jgi:hypothetical protein
MYDKEFLRQVGPFTSWQIVAANTFKTPDDLEGIPGNLVYHGGRLVSAPTLYLIWGGDVDYDRSKLERFARDLMQGPYFKRMTQYTNDSFTSSFGGSVDGPTPMGATLSSDDAIAYVNAAVDANLVPAPSYLNGAANLYALMLPPGTVATIDGEPGSCEVFCAYHSNDSHDMLFQVMVDTSCPGCAPLPAEAPATAFDIVCSSLAHEVAETCTNGWSDSWYDDSTGEENGDFCNRILEKWGPWLIQGYFINEKNPDEQPPDSDDVP